MNISDFHIPLDPIFPEICEISAYDAIEKVKNHKIDNLFDGVDEPKELEKIEAYFEKQECTLDLSQMALRVVPESMYELAHITTLNLSGNQLTTLSQKIGNLVQLKFLNISGNFFIALPPEMGSLLNLFSLDVSNNPDLAQLPPALTQIPNLRKINWAGTSINAHDAVLQDCRAKIEAFDQALLNWPGISGRIKKCRDEGWTALSLWSTNMVSLPEVIGSLRTLKYLGLRENRFERIPSFIGNMTNLQILDFKDNPLVHENALPDEFGNLTALRALNLDSCDIPDLARWSTLGKLTNLEWLHLDDNSFEALPDWIGQLSNLTHLYIGNTPAVLSTQICTLSKLRVLTLTQSVPSDIGALQNLKYLDIREALVGALPPSFATLKLEQLFLEHNTVPEQVLKLKTLKKITLSGVNAFPAALENWQNLKTLILENFESWEFPQTITKIHNLQHLVITNSTLTTTPEIDHLQNLQVLELEGHFTTIPKEICNLIHLKNFHLTAAAVRIPNEIGNLVSLRYLTLDCRVTRLPRSLGTISHLEIFTGDSASASKNFISKLCQKEKLKEEQYNQSYGNGDLAQAIKLINVAKKLEITTLKLVGFKLTILPSVLFEHKKLKVLDLSHNQLYSVKRVKTKFRKNLN